MCNVLLLQGPAGKDGSIGLTVSHKIPIIWFIMADCFHCYRFQFLLPVCLYVAPFDVAHFSCVFGVSNRVWQWLQGHQDTVFLPKEVQMIELCLGLWAMKSLDLLLGLIVMCCVIYVSFCLGLADGHTVSDEAVHLLCFLLSSIKSPTNELCCWKHQLIDCWPQKDSSLTLVPMRQMSR